MASVNPIGSVLSVTEEQLLQLHEQPRYQSLESEKFLEIFNDKKQCAQEDAVVLKALNVTHAQVSEKLSRLIYEAIAFYNMKKDENPPINPLSPDFRRPVVEIQDEGTFNVSGFDLRQMGSDYCLFCDHKTRYPAIFVVENVATHETASVRELMLHNIQAHDYFAIPGEYRIDPALICRILQLPNKSG